MSERSKNPFFVASSLNALYLAEKTQVKYYDNRSGLVDGYLDDDGLKAKLPDIVSRAADLMQADRHK
jgi:hypothetical protein